MADYNILMHQLAANGAYDNLYPKTKGALIDGAVANATNATNSTKLGGYTYQQVIENAKTQSLASGLKIQVGEYVGTGTSGASNPTSIAFSFTPKIWGFTTIVEPYSDRKDEHWSNTPNIFIFGKNTPTSNFSRIQLIVSQTIVSPSNYSINNLSYSGNSVSWYNKSSDSAGGQFNYLGFIYRWFAIG